MVVLALAGGSGIFAAFLIVFLIAVIYTLFTVTGSAISERPYSKVYGGAPGATGAGSASGHDDRVTVRNWSRGAR
ncbi:MAG: hypothetical protein ACJ76Z_05375 [Thermoleophilaceae bacterium]